MIAAIARRLIITATNAEQQQARRPRVRRAVPRQVPRPDSVRQQQQQPQSEVDDDRGGDQPGPRAAFGFLAREPGHAGDVDPERRRNEHVRQLPRGGPAQTGAAGAEDDIEEPAAPHEERPERGVLQQAVVRENARDSSSATVRLFAAGERRGGEAGNDQRRAEETARFSGMRPDGIGRLGRSTASILRSNTSLNTIPARYRQDDAASRQSELRDVGARLTCTSRKPRKTSAIAVKTAGNRQSCR